MLKGQNVRIWVAEHQNTGRISKKIIKEKLLGKHPDKKLSFDKYESYYAQPTFVSSDKYYVHCDINAYSEFDFTDAGKITLYFQEPPVIITDSGQDFAEVSSKLTGLLGRQKALPDWLYDGVILGIQEGTDVVDAKIKKGKGSRRSCGRCLVSGLVRLQKNRFRLSGHVELGVGSGTLSGTG